MIIRFKEQFALPVGVVFGYFATPADWVRLYSFSGTVSELGGGWYAVPLKRFPFPLVARITAREENTLVRLALQGFTVARKMVSRPVLPAHLGVGLATVAEAGGSGERG